MSGWVMSGWDVSSEWPCEDCLHVAVPLAHPTDVDPREPICISPVECAVDVACLRELEAEVALAGRFLAGAMQTCTVRRPELLDVLSEVLAGILAVHYDGARVPRSKIRTLLVAEVGA